MSLIVSLGKLNITIHLNWTALSNIHAGVEPGLEFANMVQKIFLSYENVTFLSLLLEFSVSVLNVADPL